MKAVFEWLFEALNEARGEIVATIVIASLGGLYKFFLKGCRRRKQEAQSKNADEANRRDEAVKRIKWQQKEQEQIKGEKQSNPISDSEFMKLYKEGDVEKIEEAIRNGVNINAKDDNGNTALIWAAFEGKTEIAELLLKYGSNINAKDNNGRTALSVARNAAIRKLILNAHSAR